MWFLENYYRLDEFLVQDCVCDGSDDKGIDGIYVDHNNQTIDVLQSKLFRNSSKTLGDTDLKEFIGTLSQFTDPDNIRNIITTTRNNDLANLLRSEDVASLIEKGYSIRGVFVTNVSRDENATRFLPLHPNLFLYDGPELQRLYIHIDISGGIQKEITFRIPESNYIFYQTKDSQAVIIPLLASELVRMEGIENQELFDWNVRQSLGKTNVNKDIASSVSDISEHANFLLYHNGVTVLCERLEIVGEYITISGYSVVNGCQSLTTIYNNRGKISDELRILARIISVPPDSNLAFKITRRTNNQNGITSRDLQSNNTLQTRLQADMKQKYPGFFYSIKRGETIEGNTIIQNDLAARLLLAFDLQEPWTCHQTYKLFEELYTRIFSRPEVNADRIVTLFLIYTTIDEMGGKITDQTFAKYSLTKFLLMYLIRRALETDTVGRELVINPTPFLNSSKGMDRVTHCVKNLLNDIIIDLNGEMKEREDNGEPFDFRRELKSPKSVRQVEKAIIPQYERAVSRNRAPSFTEEWNKSSNI